MKGQLCFFIFLRFNSTKIRTSNEETQNQKKIKKMPKINLSSYKVRTLPNSNCCSLGLLACSCWPTSTTNNISILLLLLTQSITNLFEKWKQQNNRLCRLDKYRGNDHKRNADTWHTKPKRKKQISALNHYKHTDLFRVYLTSRNIFLQKVCNRCRKTENATTIFSPAYPSAPLRAQSYLYHLSKFNKVHISANSANRRRHYVMVQNQIWIFF
jgi:hypothetical protein